jgi:myosin-5
MGILMLLDEECLVPRGSDSGLASKLYRQCTAHPRFSASTKQQVQEVFMVHHYAGAVEYGVTGFVERNKDQLKQEAMELMQVWCMAYGAWRMVHGVWCLVHGA